MKGYTIKLFNKLNDSISYVKSYKIELDDIDVEMTNDINDAIFIKEHEGMGILFNCIISAVDYRFADNVKADVIAIERSTKEIA